MATSSAKVFIVDETIDGKSLIYYKMKSKGPKIEPCGTPDRIARGPLRKATIDDDPLSPGSKKTRKPL